MFERYTEQARRVIFFSRYEASQLGADYIETEHLLLGALREYTLLRKLVPAGALEQIRTEIEKASGKRERVSTSVDMPLSGSSKRALAYGHEEAERLGHSLTGPGHLTLGLLRTPDSLAALLLVKHGVTLEKLREQLAAMAKAPQGIDNQGILRALRETFDPITRRLTPETEPATVFLLR